MEITEVGRVSAELGLGEVDAARRLTPGLGGNELWRVRCADGQRVLRIFPAGAPDAVADREAAAHRFASDHGLVVPQVLARRRIDDRPVLALEWIDGHRLAELLWSGDAPADELGRRCGDLLARLHALTPSDPLRSVVGARWWVEWAGDRAAELAPLLTADDLHRSAHDRPDHDQLDRDHDRLLHLDFHPENLIITPAGDLCLLDWANARLGPPAADLARTLSILELIEIAHPQLGERERTLMINFGDGLVDGYVAGGGEPGIPAPVQAWAYAVQLHDLAGSWVPERYFDRLRSEIARLTA